MSITQLIMNRLQSRGEYLQHLIFDENEYRKNKLYLDTFMIDDELLIPKFSIQTTNFRFEYTNQTGKEVKDRIKDFLF